MSIADIVERPGMRQALIRDGMQGDLEIAGIGILKHLKPNWTYGDLSGAIASMDIADIIQQQAEKKSFWQVDEQFWQEYPQYARTHLNTVAAC